MNNPARGKPTRAPAVSAAAWALALGYTIVRTAALLILVIQLLAIDWRGTKTATAVGYNNLFVSLMMVTVMLGGVILHIVNTVRPRKLEP